METLEHAIKVTGGVTKLADDLGVRQNVVSNWRTRGRLPKAWDKLLRLKYPEPSPSATHDSPEPAPQES